MPRGDIHNRKRKLENAKTRIRESEDISEHNKKIILNIDSFNVSQREVGVDRRCRELESWYSLATHIGDKWKLDNPTKKRIDNLLEDIQEGRVTEKSAEELSPGQINEFKKSLNKLYHSREKGSVCYLKHNNPNYNGNNYATFTYSTTDKDVDPNTVLKPEDIAKLVNASNRVRNKAYIMLMYSTAARVGEVMGLKWKDIELTRIQGNRLAKIRFVGRDDKNQGETKTNTRTVPIREGYTFIKRLKEIDPLSDNPNAYMFRPLNSTDPERQLSHSSGGDMVKEALRNLKNSEIEWNPNRKTNNHNFRHSRATYWASEGMNESQIRELGGWSDSSDTVKRYIHLGKKDVEGSVLDFHGLEREETESDFTLEPVPCEECNTLNPFNATNCKTPGCDNSLTVKEQTKKLWIEETSKEVAFSVADSTQGISEEDIENKAKELVKEKMSNGELPD